MTDNLPTSKLESHQEQPAGNNVESHEEPSQNFWTGAGSTRGDVTPLSHDLIAVKQDRHGNRHSRVPPLRRSATANDFHSPISSTRLGSTSVGISRHQQTPPLTGIEEPSRTKNLRRRHKDLMDRRVSHPNILSSTPVHQILQELCVSSGQSPFGKERKNSQGSI